MAARSSNATCTQPAIIPGEKTACHTSVIGLLSLSPDLELEREKRKRGGRGRHKGHKNEQKLERPACGTRHTGCRRGNNIMFLRASDRALAKFPRPLKWLLSGLASLSSSCWWSSQLPSPVKSSAECLGYGGKCTLLKRC